VKEPADDTIRFLRRAPLDDVSGTRDDSIFRPRRHLGLPLHGRRVGLVDGSRTAQRVEVGGPLEAVARGAAA